MKYKLYNIYKDIKNKNVDNIIEINITKLKRQ